jgi:hypothetical protein
MKTKKSSFSATPPAPNSVAHDIIAQRAEAIWRERGSPAGRDLDHWLEAERQLYNRKNPRVRGALERDPGEFAQDPENALKDRADQEIDEMDDPPAQRSATSL